MKVLLLTNKLPFPETDGGSIAIASMIRGYVQAGCAVKLLGINPEHQHKAPTLPPDLQDSVKLRAVSLSTKVKPLGAFFNLITGEPYHVSRFYQTEFSVALSEVLLSFQPDVVQFEGLQMAVYLHEVRNQSKAKCILRSHNIEHQIWQRLAHSARGLKKRYLGIQTKRLAQFEKTQVPLFDGILAITPNDAAFFAPLNPKVLTLPCGLDFSHIREPQNLPADLFFIGSMDWQPNVEGMQWFFKSVWPKVLAQLPEAQFHLAGKKLNKSAFAGIKNLEVHGEVTNAETFVKAHGILVVPLLSGSGMRIKIIEAFRAGRAVVSTPVGIEGIEAKPGKHAMIASTPDEMATAILALLRNAEKRNLISRQGQAWAAQHFDNSKLGQRGVDWLEDGYL